MEPPDLQYEFSVGEGTLITIRPIRPDDAEIEQRFVRLLSPRAKRLRFLGAVDELTPRMLDKFTHTNYPQEMALIATVMTSNAEVEIGVARYAPSSEEGTVEFAVVVADGWAGRGVGSELLRRLFEIAEGAGLNYIEGIVLRENHRMIELARGLGFKVESYPEDAGLLRIRKSVQSGD